MDANAAMGLELNTQVAHTGALFEEAAFDYYRMPRPQYLGAKHELTEWIARFMPNDARVALDGFGGSQSVSFMMKKMGYAVHTNDFLKCCHCAGESLIENVSARLDEGDIALLFSENGSRKNVMMNFRDIFFSERECIMLDNFRANADLLSCPYKKSMAITVMCRSLTRKTTMGHFAHLKAMEYARDPKRVKRNPSLAKDIKDLFKIVCAQYNAAVFDNGRRNKSHNGNILDILPGLRGVDFAYYDPPYCGSHADYQAFYHVLETFAENWDDRQFINATKRYYPPRHSGFDKSAQVVESFNKLFELSADIPTWIVSYNDRSLPAIETLIKMAASHGRRVQVEEKVYANSRGGKGSVSGSKEYLLICR